MSSERFESVVRLGCGTLLCAFLRWTEEHALSRASRLLASAAASIPITGHMRFDEASLPPYMASLHHRACEPFPFGAIFACTTPLHHDNPVVLLNVCLFLTSLLRLERLLDEVFDESTCYSVGVLFFFSFFRDVSNETKTALFMSESVRTTCAVPSPLIRGDARFSSNLSIIMVTWALT